MLWHLSEAVAEFHEESTQIALQAGLQVSLAVTLRQVEEIEQEAVLEDACRILRQNSHRWCEFLVGLDSSLEGCGFDLTGKLAFAPLPTLLQTALNPRKSATDIAHATFAAATMQKTFDDTLNK
jgi:hypothetical protein